MLVIEFDSVWKTYPKKIGDKAYTALSDASFALNQGQTLGLVGANGAGKSTALRLLMGFMRPDKGSIRVFNETPTHHHIRHRIGYLPETASFPPNLNMLDMLRFTGKTCLMTGAQIVTVSEKWLKVLGLWDARKRPLRNYSKGMQQRANFVLALLNNPDLLILDEPMSGLDPFGRAEIYDLILELKKQGKSIIFCSHILEDVDQLVDNILVLHKGINLFSGKVVDLIAQQNTNSFVNAFLKIVGSKDECGSFNFN